MAALVWIMIGIALWHFSIFVPDHFWSGIVGAFVGAVLGSFFFGFIIHGLTVPGQNDTTVLNAIEAVPARGPRHGRGLLDRAAAGAAVRATAGSPPKWPQRPPPTSPVAFGGRLAVRGGVLEHSRARGTHHVLRPCHERRSARQTQRDL